MPPRNGSARPIVPCIESSWRPIAPQLRNCPQGIGWRSSPRGVFHQRCPLCHLLTADLRGRTPADAGCKEPEIFLRPCEVRAGVRAPEESPRLGRLVAGTAAADWGGGSRGTGHLPLTRGSQANNRLPPIQGSQRARSRWIVRIAQLSASSRAERASLIATDRCLPPVHPIATDK